MYEKTTDNTFGKEHGGKDVKRKNEPHERTGFYTK